MGNGVTQQGIIVLSLFDPIRSGFLSTFGVMLRYGSWVGTMLGLNLFVFYFVMNHWNCDCFMVDNLWRSVMLLNNVLCGDCGVMSWSHNCMMCRRNNHLVVMNHSWLFSGGVVFWLGRKTFQMRLCVVMVNDRFQVFADDRVVWLVVAILRNVRELNLAFFGVLKTLVEEFKIVLGSCENWLSCQIHGLTKLLSGGRNVGHFVAFAIKGKKPSNLSKIL